MTIKLDPRSERAKRIRGTDANAAGRKWMRRAKFFLLALLSARERDEYLARFDKPHKVLDAAQSILEREATHD